MMTIAGSHNTDSEASHKLSGTRIRGEELIFLLGAGASVDAGMPTVTRLTQKLRECLPKMCDINGNPCPEFAEVFDLFAENNPLLAGSYERFFEWVSFLLNAQKKIYRRFCEVKIDPALVEKMSSIPFVVGEQIASLLASCPTSYNYLARFGDFLPESGRLRIFTLNFDCCLEDSCAKTGIDVTTGFDSITKKWNPSQFKRHERGINLYKLHGSLRWFGTRDLNLPEDRFQHYLELMEMEPEERESLGSHLDIRKAPEIILGPGFKVQVDDPFLTLLYEFHLALQKSKLCVVIGFSYGDEHIRIMLEKAFDAGLSILDVNPSNIISSPFFGEGARYNLLRKRSKEALEGGGLTRLIVEFIRNGSF